MNLFGDLQCGKILQIDELQFVVGKNFGCIEGLVVYENDLIQLIQYMLKMDKVFEWLLLIVLLCINKFYIFDLQLENLFVVYVLLNGYQVFFVLWCNVDVLVVYKMWDDYMNEGLFVVIDVVQQISGCEQINMFGFCVGGMMFVIVFVVFVVCGEYLVVLMMLFIVMFDFIDMGIFDVFVDEVYVQMCEQIIGGKNGVQLGLMCGVEFVNMFLFLWLNDFVWNYVVDNYLKGCMFVLFDLLYWNSDLMSLLGLMYVWYLCYIYLENKLCELGVLIVCGELVDLLLIDVLIFIYGLCEDYIVLWQMVYVLMLILLGLLKFVFGVLGYIVGVINLLVKKKCSYWVNEGDLFEFVDDWFVVVIEQLGSWWMMWVEWFDVYGGCKVVLLVQLGFV